MSTARPEDTPPIPQTQARNEPKAKSQDEAALHKAAEDEADDVVNNLLNGPAWRDKRIIALIRGLNKREMAYLGYQVDDWFRPYKDGKLAAPPAFAADYESPWHWQYVKRPIVKAYLYRYLRGKSIGPEFFARYHKRPAAKPMTANLPQSVKDMASIEGRLGISVQGKDNSLSISSVPQGSPSQQAGLRQGDTLLSVDGRNVSSADDVSARLSEKKAGSTVSLGIERQGRRVTIQVPLDDPGVSAKIPEEQH